MADVKDTVKDTFSALLNKAQSLGKSAVETAKGAAEKGKEAVEEHLREREAAEIYRKLGKKVFKLVSRDELTLPESCEKYIEALKDLYEEEDETPSGEQEACCCTHECGESGDKAEECDDDKAECTCDDKTEESSDDNAECACDAACEENDDKAKVEE